MADEAEQCPESHGAEEQGAAPSCPAKLQKLLERQRNSVGASSDGRPGEICLLCWCTRGDHLPDHREKRVICPLPPLPPAVQLDWYRTYCTEGMPEAREVDVWEHCRFGHGTDARCPETREPGTIFCAKHSPAA